MAERVLGEAGITVNKNMVPFDDKSAFTTSGIRVGTAAITTRGLKEAEMETVVSFIDEALMNPEDEAKLSEIHDQVNDMMEKFPLYR